MRVWAMHLVKNDDYWKKDYEKEFENLNDIYVPVTDANGNWLVQEARPFKLLEQLHEAKVYFAMGDMYEHDKEVQIVQRFYPTSVRVYQDEAGGYWTDEAGYCELEEG